MDYKTAAAPARAEYEEKRSRFIASLSPVENEEQTLDFIGSVKSEFYDARHNVYAYVIKDGAVRFSDDGEPQGTAGMPALEVLRRRGVTNTVVVVTRYFGGILLGAPGLVRAYTHAAAMALDAAGVAQMTECDLLRLICGYSFYSQAEKLIGACGGSIKSRDFMENVNLEIVMPKDKTENFQKALTQASGGTLAASADGECYINSGTV